MPIKGLNTEQRARKGDVMWLQLVKVFVNKYKTNDYGHTRCVLLGT